MKNHSRCRAVRASAIGLAACLFWAAHAPGQIKYSSPHYKVLSAATEGNLAVYPVIADAGFDTNSFLTLEEGVHSGQVVVTEAAQSTGLVRPRRTDDHGVWSERPIRESEARVNELAIVNNADRPLILLAGEIVTGGKQDRVVSRDRIIPAHSQPIALGVFCVEPHRWTETSARFGALHSAIAQPSVRSKAMADADQQKVWNEVAKSRHAFVAAAPAVEARALQSTSSYATAIQNGGVQQRIDSIAAPIQHSYDQLFKDLRSQKAVGVVVAVNGEIIWADVFASSGLLEKYWPKLIRSYAAEALGSRMQSTAAYAPPTQAAAQDFLDRLNARHETVETEPSLYRNTEISGENFDAFVLTALLPHTGFNVHIAKMKR